MSGTMLTGKKPFIDAARVWRRHGGHLFRLRPPASIARRSFDERIVRMAAYSDAAVRVARAFAAYPRVAVRPRQPRTNVFHAFMRGSAAETERRVADVAREHQVWTIGQLGPTTLPAVRRREISCGDATPTLSDVRLRFAPDGLFAESG
jgi:threonine aldolase